MDYDHDIFLSYPRGHHSADWVTEPFLRLFRSYLEDDLGTRVRIFWDQKGIRAGDSWPQRLRSALSRSRCMVSIWCPEYFHSDWCKRECAAFLHREKALKYRTDSKPGGLIIPVKVGDGNHFPDAVQSIQCLDCRDFCFDGESWKKTEIYVLFQKQLKTWVENFVVPTVRDAPENCCEEWSSKKWTEDPLLSYDLSPRINFPLPAIE